MSLCLNMQEPPTPFKSPKKRAPIKKQASICLESPSEPLSSEVARLKQLVKQLQERQAFFERDLSSLLELLSEQEGSSESTQEEEEMN